VLDLRGVPIGVAAGLFGGLAGLGGGVVMVPLMMTIARLDRHRAHATSLVAVVATGAFGAWSYATGGAVAWRLALVIALASTVGAVLSSALAARVPARRLGHGFHWLQVMVALSLPFADVVSPVRAAVGVWELPIAILVGMSAGVLAGLLGIGGGAVVVPLLVFLFGFEQHLAQGTSLAVMIPAGLAGSIVHARGGRVSGPLAPTLALGVAAGAFAGGQVALALPEMVLRVVFAAVLAWMGIRGLHSDRAAVTSASTRP
jgi:uncharacterized protein